MSRTLRHAQVHGVVKWEFWHMVQERETNNQGETCSIAYCFQRVFLLVFYASFHTIRFSPSLALSAAGARGGRAEGLEQTTQQEMHSESGRISSNSEHVPREICKFDWPIAQPVLYITTIKRGASIFSIQGLIGTIIPSQTR